MHCIGLRSHSTIAKATYNEGMPRPAEPGPASGALPGAARARPRFLPEDFKHTPVEKFSHNHDLEDIYKSAMLELGDEAASEAQQDDYELAEAFLLQVLQTQPSTEAELQKAITAARRELHATVRKSSLVHALARMLASKDPRLEPHVLATTRLKQLLIKKAGKSASGVLVVTMLTSPRPMGDNGKPQNFTCQWNCHYCPAEPGQPRSYLHDEPSVLRANRDGFDPVLQFFDRVATLCSMGHPCDKVELLILGGTWDSYPLVYRETFCRDIFYAANCFSADMATALERTKRPRGTLEEEKRTNETTDGCKIIGLTMETRPDCITKESLAQLRRFGCTRVQLGLQHTNDAVLKLINRGHDVVAAARALQLLKDSCFKVDLHLMPNLPGSDAAEDKRMLARALGDADLQADQWKIYPTEVTPWTVIERWFTEGSYKPYGETELLEVLVQTKSRMHPWVRINRVVRDIPSQYILGGVNAPSMRQDLQVEMKRRGAVCHCVRCREIGSTNFTTADVELIERWYMAQGASEVFLEVGVKGKVIGFCRLRLPLMPGAFEEVQSCALVRELHVYGQLAPTKEVLAKGALDGQSTTQHVGVGSRLMAKAEQIALERGFNEVAVIAGVGARGFYAKLGYQLRPGAGEMMCKVLRSKSSWKFTALGGDGGGSACGVM